ncbi:MAG TPA: hypothetical protein VFA46_09075 [Actinomycetes bacterium]|nr:hypothetical protein [Actinomycetes bacterium]
MHELLALGGRECGEGLFPDLVAHLGGVADGLMPSRGQLKQRRAAVARVHLAGQQALLFEHDVAKLIVFLGSAANANLTGELLREGSSAGRSGHVV